MKKFSAILLAIVLMLSMVAMAEATHTITVSGAVNGETYTAWKVFDLIVSADGKNYAYTANADVYTALNGKVAGLSFVATTDNNIYNVVQFDQTVAEALTEYLNDNKVGTQINDAEASNNTAVIDVSAGGSGYYFVDSTLGALCAIDTATNTSATVYEKNSVPSIEKLVKDGSYDDGAVYAATANVGYGDTVKYQLTVNTGTNANAYDDDDDSSETQDTGVDANYVIVDTLPAGITTTGSNVAVKVGDSVWTYGTDYTATVAADKTKITFTLLGTGALKTLDQDTDIVITYDAFVESTASIETALTNKAVLTYKEQTDDAEATVYVFNMKLNKVDSENAPLTGAEFTLKDNAKNELVYFTVSNGVYTVVPSTTTGATTKIEAGSVEFKGLDAGSYTLAETKAPDGYNKLPADIAVVITENTTTHNGDVTKDGTAAADDTIIVVNQSGSELPSTGGIGTTIFYVVGGVLMAAAIVLLVSKRKVAASK